MNGMSGIDCSSPSGTCHIGTGFVGFHPTLYCSSPSETRTAACDTFEATFATAASAQAEHVAATADTAAKIREGIVAVRTADGIVQNKYANDPGKLAAWLSAKHGEKDPKKKAPTP